MLILRQPHKKNNLAPVSGERVRVRGFEPEPTERMVLRMQLIGASPNPQVVGLDELPGKSNYFIDNDPKNWHTNIPTYAGVQYKDIYPGINLIYYGNQRQLEYDFVVTPDADPKVIRLAFDGLVGAGPRACPQEGDHRGSPLQIDDNGDLILQTASGEIRLHKPLIYQEINGLKQAIAGGYVLLDLGTRNSELETQTVGFQVATYDTSKLLVIDPVLSYSTYLGGRAADEGLGVAVDSSGNAYVTGFTFSTDFPTASPSQAAHGGDIDVFIAKIADTAVDPSRAEIHDTSSSSALGTGKTVMPGKVRMLFTSCRASWGVNGELTRRGFVITE